MIVCSCMFFFYCVSKAVQKECKNKSGDVILEALTIVFCGRFTYEVDNIVVLRKKSERTL